MSEPKLISPLLDNFMLGEAMSDHDGVRCYPAMKNDSDTRYIVKIISIPASPAQLNALLLSGAFSGKASAAEYFAQLSKDIIKEAEILDKLSKLEGFLPLEGCQVIANEDNSGYDIYLLYHYRRSLERHCRKSTMTHLAAVNLGIDMCASLAVCRQAGYLYVDLKPGNIFLCNEKEYRIGDIGFVQLNNLQFATLPDRYHSPYIPPELHDPFASIDMTADTYAAGMVLYQIYNGGVLPYDGQVPDGPLQPPLYADYEMSEIIMKACASDPGQRWDDPVKMGQAIVSYMQRNIVNDTPIIPLPSAADIPLAYSPDISEEKTPTESPNNAGPDESPVSGDETGIDALMNALVADETAPQETMADVIPYSEVSDDASDILALADDLIAHELPAPPVAPEAIDVPIPAPINVVADPEQNECHDNNIPTVEEVAEGSPVDETVAAISEAVAASDNPLETEIDTEILLTGAEENIDSTAQAGEDEIVADGRSAAKKTAWFTRILTGVLVLILVSSLALGGYLFYRDYYMKTIDTMTIEGIDDRLTVYITTKADPSLLTVICTDTYGNRHTAPVENGTAKFSNLTPDTLYTITMDIDGFHGLRGQIKGTHTTAPQTEIVAFNPVTGSEAGSVILNFTVKGHNSDKWIISYVADGEPERSVTFSGHSTTITGLTVGKTYTFTLDSVHDVYIVGQNSIQYSAIDLIYPQNLAVTSINTDGLQVTWEKPENVNVDYWTVMCYNEAGFNQNLTTSETSASFTDLVPTDSYTVEVTASGMSVGSRFYVSKNSVTLTSVSAIPNGYYMDVSWEYTGPSPAADWVLTYSIDDDTSESVVSTDGVTARIENLVPNSSYTLKLQLADGTTVLNDTVSVKIPEAEAFANYTVSASDMKLSMCLVPEVADWTHYNVSTYKDSFFVGEKAGFVMRLYRKYNTSPDIITTLFVIRNAEGDIVKLGSSSQSWTSMWYQFYGELTIPEMPAEPGDYTIEIYFNSAYVHKQAFTVVEPETAQ